MILKFDMERLGLKGDKVYINDGPLCQAQMSHEHLQENWYSS